MKYDFETIYDRVGKDAIAVDGIGEPFNIMDKPREGFDPISMWVADMNFATVPTVVQEIAKRLEHPLFGYFPTRKEYFDSIISWQKRRNGVEGLEAKNIGHENGVLGGVVSALNILCSKGDNVLVHSPTYIGFTKTLKNNGYNIVHSPLYLDENDVWRMDYEDMEKKIVDNNITVAIMCNPHNPTGRVWEREELERAIDIFERHHVYIISDEIWSDIILYDNKHIPTQSVNEYAHENTIAFYALSKTFNLAALVEAYHIVYSDYLNKRLQKESSLPHYNEENLLSMYALIGAYKDEGEEWLGELLQVLAENTDIAYDYFAKKLEGTKVGKPEGTYMFFVDFEDYCKKNNITIKELLKAGWSVGVMWQDGTAFGGEYTIRMNLASPTARIKEAIERLDKYVFNK
ncbi:MAG: aminotransferase class I/II-fold pyridoxal phosphate-dependent enzyme [Finegoldia sp.]|nr:aminotransferase class I/II-fold pyridoxal phosphate-dependent enzyme [Finegoldia sp.]